MKHSFLIALLLGLCLSFNLSAQKQATQKDNFTHPGIAHTKESIDFVKKKIAAKQQPWLKAWQDLCASKHASLNYKPQPRKLVERGPYNNPDIGSSEFSDDGKAAHTHALCWALTGNEAHAKKAAEILDAWSTNLKTIKNHDARLLVGMVAPHYCIAADIIKHTWTGWSEKNQQQFAALLNEVFYPIIKDFYPSANGNWDASMIQAMIAMAVFLDDQAMFDKATTYYLKGKGNGAIGNYFIESGQCQESGRDQAHTQMGIRFLTNTAETAWIQKIDLYGALDNRLLKGLEYTAKYNLGNDVPYVPYTSYQERYHYKNLSDDARGRLQSMYEKAYNHYNHRKDLDAPYTLEAALKNRTYKPRKRSRPRRNPRSRTEFYIDTLMYAQSEQ